MIINRQGKLVANRIEMYFSLTHCVYIRVWNWWEIFIFPFFLCYIHKSVYIHNFTLKEKIAFKWLFLRYICYFFNNGGFDTTSKKIYCIFDGWEFRLETELQSRDPSENHLRLKQATQFSLLLILFYNNFFFYDNISRLYSEFHLYTHRQAF